MQVWEGQTCRDDDDDDNDDDDDDDDDDFGGCVYFCGCVALRLFMFG